MPFPLIRVVKSLLFLYGGDISTNVNFLYKRKIVPYFYSFPASAGFQWPLTQNNPCAKEIYSELAYYGTLH